MPLAKTLVIELSNAIFQAPRRGERHQGLDGHNAHAHDGRE
jgi:hypothetical protein